MARLARHSNAFKWDGPLRRRISNPDMSIILFFLALHMYIREGLFVSLLEFSPSQPCIGVCMK